MSDVFNLLDGALDGEEEQPGYRNRRTQVGAALGAELLGATLYETPPGEKLWPYHWELGCEEFVVVVSGTPTLRTPEGERVLEPGDLVAFPEGEAGAHQLRNDSDEPFRVLIGSTKSGVYVAGYPDSGKLSSTRHGPQARDAVLATGGHGAERRRREAVRRGADTCPHERRTAGPSPSADVRPGERLAREASEALRLAEGGLAGQRLARRRACAPRACPRT